LNWGFYAAEEFYISSHVLRQGGTFLQWTEEFATTIDEFAWFGLLFMFELETYSLDQSLNKRWVRWSIHGMRLVCYVFLAHTVYARVNSMVDVFAVDPSSTTFPAYITTIRLAISAITPRSWVIIIIAVS